MRTVKAPVFPGLNAEKARHGHSTADVAQFLGISEDAEWRRETGRANYTLPQIRKLMGVYGKTFEDLFSNDEQKTA